MGVAIGYLKCSFDFKVCGKLYFEKCFLGMNGTVEKDKNKQQNIFHDMV